MRSQHDRLTKGDGSWLDTELSSPTRVTQISLTSLNPARRSIN
jgi:hypothetical protein